MKALQSIGLVVLFILFVALLNLGVASLGAMAWNAVLGPRLFMVTTWEMWLLIFLGNLIFGTFVRRDDK